MSFDLLRTAKHVEGLSNAQFRVLFYLLEAANNDTYQCFPSMKEIGQFCRMHPRTVQRHITDLADMGLFEKFEQRRADGSRAVNLYRFVVHGTIKVGTQEIKDIRAKPAENCDFEQPDIFVMGGGQQPDSFVGGPPTVLSEHISGITSQESTPTLPTEEYPPKGEEDLFGELIPAVERPLTLLEHVQQGWESLRAECPKIPRVVAWNDTRKRAIEKRAKDFIKDAGINATPQQVWDMIFKAIRLSPGLRGDAPPSKGYDKSYVVELDHLLRAGKFAQIIERAPRDAEINRSSYDPDTGRQLGEGAKAERNWLQRQRARRQQREQG